MGIKIIKVNVEINMDDLEDIKSKTQIEPDKIPTVSDDYVSDPTHNNTTYYKEYIKGNKWIRIEGNGENIELCDDIIIRRSPGNEDKLYDKITFNHPKYGIGLYDNHPKNLYIQAIKLEQLLNIGYIEGKSNLIELVD